MRGSDEKICAMLWTISGVPEIKILNGETNLSTNDKFCQASMMSPTVVLAKATNIEQINKMIAPVLKVLNGNESFFTFSFCLKCTDKAAKTKADASNRNKTKIRM